MGTPTRRGFSLIELMVVIGIIALILAIALPALGGARSTAKQTLALANMRSTQQLFARYATDHGQYPFRGVGDQPAELEEPVEPNALTFSWYPEGVILATSDHFEQAVLWPAIVAPIDEWPGIAETWVSPGRDFELPRLEDLMNGLEIEPGEMFSIVYSHSFVARPTLWMPERGKSVDRLAELRPTRASEVRAPAGKVMLWDRHLAYLSKEPEREGEHYRAKTPMAFADGHGALEVPSEASAGVANPLNGGNETRLHNTAQGVYGLDYD
ncbi:MAG: type II secretion system protein [Phycisphaerales bacterium JB059]